MVSHFFWRYIFLGTSATILSHIRLSYSSAYTAYDGGVMALSEIVVD